MSTTLDTCYRRLELWLPIKGFPGYEVSSWGRVRSLDRITTGFHKNGYKGRILSTRSNNGYPTVTLRKMHDPKRYTFLVQRLVLEAFRGPCPEGMEACHFPDQNRANCSVWNLRWDTRKNNHADKKVHGTSLEGEKNPAAHFDEDEVREIRRWARLKDFNQTHFARKKGVRQSTISNIINFRTWKHVR